VSTSSALYRLPSPTPGSASGIYPRSIAAVLTLLLVAFWSTTQWSAWRFGFSPALGAAWLHLAPPAPKALPAGGSDLGRAHARRPAVAANALGRAPLRSCCGSRAIAVRASVLRALGLLRLGLALRAEPGRAVDLRNRPLADRDPGARLCARRRLRVRKTREATRPANRQPRLGPSPGRRAAPSWRPSSPLHLARRRVRTARTPPLRTRLRATSRSRGRGICIRVALNDGLARNTITRNGVHLGRMRSPSRFHASERGPIDSGGPQGRGIMGSFPAVRGASPVTSSLSVSRL